MERITLEEDTLEENIDGTVKTENNSNRRWKHWEMKNWKISWRRVAVTDGEYLYKKLNRYTSYVLIPFDIIQLIKSQNTYIYIFVFHFITEM